MLINNPMCDWLTLMSAGDYDMSVCYSHWSDWWSDGKSDKDSKVLQFVGKEGKDGVFCGSGDVNGEIRQMVRASGATAENVMHSYLLLCNDVGCDAYASRIDIQITVPQPGGYNGRLLKDELKRSMARSVELREDSEDMVTVYVGSRVSDRYARIYQKVDSDGRHYVRFEVEFKKGRSKEFWSRLRESRDASLLIRQVLINEVASVVGQEQWASLRGLLMAGLGDYTGSKIQVSRRKKGSTEIWLDEVVAPMIIKRLLSHDVDERFFARTWVRSLCDIMRSIDDGQD